MMTSGRVRLLVALVVAAMLAGSWAVSCASGEAGGEAGPRSGTVDLRWDLPEGSRWELAGPLVDAGAICARGYNRTVAILDPTTRESLTAAEFWRRVDQLTPGHGVDAIMVDEKRCADGSGSFVTEDWPAGDEFRVVSGTGAYRSMRGEGAATGGMDLDANPDWVEVRLELDLDAATSVRQR